MQEMDTALALALDNAGSSIAARMAMMAMTTNNSIKVNARRKLVIIPMEDTRKPDSFQTIFHRSCPQPTRWRFCKFTAGHFAMRSRRVTWFAKTKRLKSRLRQGGLHPRQVADVIRRIGPPFPIFHMA